MPVSVEGLQAISNLDNNNTQNIERNQQYSALQQVAQQAAGFAKQGDYASAYGLMIKANPQNADKYIGDLTKLDPVLAQKLQQSVTTGQMAGLSPSESTPGQVAHITADGRIAASEARAQKAEEALKYQTNPYTGAKDVYQGQKHLGTLGPDGNLIPASTKQTEQQIVPETPQDILKPIQEKKVVAAAKDFSKQTKDLNEEIDGADRLKDLVSKNIPGSQLAQAMTFLTREEHVKRFNEAEFQKFGGDQNSILQRIQNAASQGAAGKLPPDQQQYLISLADAVQKQALRAYTDQAEAQVNTLTQQGISPKAALNRIIGGAPKAVREYAKNYLGLEGQDKEAVDWARKNVQDPKAQQILQLHGL